MTTVTAMRVAADPDPARRAGITADGPDLSLAPVGDQAFTYRMAIAARGNVAAVE